MQKYKITLTDALRHPGYNWPMTLLSYPVELNVKKSELSSLHLLDDQNNEIPFQLSDVHDCNGGIGANIYFTADMPYGTEHTYFLKNIDSQGFSHQKGLIIEDEKEDTFSMSNQEICLKVNKRVNISESGKYQIFNISGIGEGINCNAFLSSSSEVVSYSAMLAAKGCVFADCLISIGFSSGASYKLKLRITHGIEFIEMQEEAAGFEESSKTKLLLEWSNFNPDKRYAQYREYEKIDCYNEKEYMPFKLLPYTSWVGWWSSKTAAFIDGKKGKSVGVFVKDVEKWDDGKYAIWGSPETQAVSFRYEMTPDMEGRLTFEYPIIDGFRCTAVALYECCRDTGYDQKCYIDYLWFWHEFLNLNKVKNWILRWDEDKSAYPRFFPESSMPEPGVEVWHYGVRKEAFSPEFMEDIIYHLSHNMNQLHSAGPVSAREFFSWVYVFDMAAPKMTQRQFDDFKACCAFMAYAHMSESFMPIENMLAGHPNFLADMRAVPALMAPLFPMHPHAKLWVNQFEKAMALNLKYHVRPEVKAWQSKAGRWTENLGCYNFASLVPMMKTAALVHNAFGENILMYPNIVKWTQWMIDVLTAPVNGKRTYPPQGAHSGYFADPMIPTSSLRFLSDRLIKYSPMQSEYLMYICKPDAPSFEERIPNSDIYKCLFDNSLKENCGTRPKLESSKFTGYGYVLRSSVGDESEVSVHLQQIDEGPNYRWGRAGQGGCGIIYYNAAGTRYSYNRPEDVGDANMGDVQNSCNFGILIGHEYRSVGRNDLSEPMYDFGFAQYAQINAGEYSQPFYRSRSVILSGNDYIAVYDQVGDMRVRGRFSWFVKESEKFPQIAQLKPGVQGVQVNPGYPIEETGDKPIVNNNNSKGLQFDGSGDFLTLVSHRSLNSDCNTYTSKTDYGAEVRLQGRTDRIFRDGGLIIQEDEFTSFCGYAGIVRLYGKSKAQGALFKGTRIGALGVEISIVQETGDDSAAVGISFSVENGRLSGKASCSKAVKVRVNFSKTFDPGKFKLYIDSDFHEVTDINGSSIIFFIPEGTHTWQWTDCCPMPQNVEIVSTNVISSGVDVNWEDSNGAEGYEIQNSRDCGKSWSTMFYDIKKTHCKLTGFDNGTKIHLRIRGCNKDYQGEWSHDYPVYITDRVPDAPEGLKVWKSDSGYKMLWGWQLGAVIYRLYRREKATGDFIMLYESTACEYADNETFSGKIYEYAVSAVNGNGEGQKSHPRDTAPGGLAYWDPQPETAFRRYTRSHEYGYNGFDHVANENNRKILQYPD